MPEPYHRCADPSCHQTFIAHEDETVVTCSDFKAPAFGGAYDELAACVRTVGQDGGKPIQVVLYADARRAVTVALQSGEEAVASLAAANAEALENWGAFDYELLLLAENYGLDLEGDPSPLEIVEALIGAALKRGLHT